MTTVTLPNALVAGQPENVNALNGNLTAIVTVVNGGLDNSNVAASAGIVDTKLASPNNAIWRTLAEGQFNIAAGTAAGTYWLRGDSGLPVLSGASGQPVPVNLDPAEFAIAGKTAKLRLRVNLVAGGAPGVTLTFGVHPISSLSGTTSIAVTIGSGATGSGVALAPVANAYAQGVSTTFDFPAVGGYLFGVFLPGPTAANSVISGRTQLSISHV